MISGDKVRTLDDFVDIEDKCPNLIYGIKWLKRDIERAADVIPRVKERKDRMLSKVKNIEKRVGCIEDFPGYYKLKITPKDYYELMAISLDVASESANKLRLYMNSSTLSEDERDTIKILLLNRTNTYSRLYRDMYTHANDETKRKMSEYNYRAVLGGYWLDVASTLAETLSSPRFIGIYTESSRKVHCFSSCDSLTSYLLAGWVVLTAAELDPKLQNDEVYLEFKSMIEDEKRRVFEFNILDYTKAHLKDPDNHVWYTIYEKLSIGKKDYRITSELLKIWNEK